MSSSDNDSDTESYNIHLKSMKTLKQLYKSGALKATSGKQTRYKSSSTHLDRVSLYKGDITKVEVDVIVNAANKSLLGGGGVDGAIHTAAGSKLLDECRGLNGCLTGESKITRGYNLPASYVIHTVGPVYSLSDTPEKAQQLASCYKSSLDLAIENSLRHIAFPSISTGIYGYPIEDATHIALDEVRKCCDSVTGDKLERIIFVVYNEKDKKVYESLIPEYFPPSDIAEETNTEVQS